MRYLSLLIILLLPLLAPAWQASAQPGPSNTVYLPIVRGGAAPAPGSPIIESFSASAGNGPMAAAIELRWQVRDATSLQITPFVGEVDGRTSAVVYPLASTTYTLTARNAKGAATATVSYTVSGPPVPNPLTVRAEADPGRAATATLGPEGGSIQATAADGTRYTLTVPPDALLDSEPITLTPALRLTGLPSAIGPAAAATIEPEGLVFIEPATLTITPPSPPPLGALRVGFAYQSAGAEFHLRDLAPAAASAQAEASGGSQVSVVQARSYGAATVPDDDLLAPLVEQAPSDPLDAAEHAYNAAVDRAQQGTIRELLATSLRESYYVIVGYRLSLASANPDGPAPLDLDTATRYYIEWRARVRAAGLDEQLSDESRDGDQLLRKGLARAGELATERCNQSRPSQGFALQRYAAYARRFGLTATRAALQQRLRECWQFKLRFDSTITERGPGYAWDYTLRAAVDLAYDEQTGRLRGSAPLTWVKLVWGGESGDCRFVTGTVDSMLDAASGELGLSLRPVSRTSPEVRLQLAYDPGAPAELLTIICPNSDPRSVRTTAWRSYFGQTHAGELKGGAFVAVQRAVTSGSIPPWVYHSTATGPSGQAVVEDTTIVIEHTPAR